MMSQSGLPYKFWAEAMNTAVYLVNLSPSSVIDFSTPFELRHKRVADYSRLRIFGCTAYPLIPKEHMTKLDPTSKKCRFLGYANVVKGYMLWDPVACKGKPLLPDIVEREIDHYGFNDKPQGENPEQLEGVPHQQELEEQEVIDRDDDGNVLILEEGEPSSYREAQASIDKLEWDAAMEREMQSLNDNKTWKLVKLPPGQQVMDSKWVYKLKDSPTESVGKIYKARLVTKLSSAQCPTDVTARGLMSKIPYDEAVGSHMYLMISTRSDIAMAMGKNCVSQSNIEVEYVAAAEAAKEAICLNRLVAEMGLSHDIVNLHCDSQSTLHLAVNQVMNSWVKHIDIRYHFMREAVSDKKMELVKIDGKLNPADAFTKVIPLESFARHRSTLEIVDIEQK
ncbi:hypothetical protein AXG93_3256s1720 [Marchantia polymorpha subsp. ruderalis]|uniref:Retroviral polymerase SH3-like domain-containing protein n=1 Tax=Marchantia polymorpha subsp. ruderalis TaxID=1480154 RepID=A0A176VLX0_MARPO|nr:hypothetical protein AXG93_3256s1720 [Marchantia polymorpha subsp. ruderalis]